MATSSGNVSGLTGRMATSTPGKSTGLTGRMAEQEPKEKNVPPVAKIKPVSIPAPKEKDTWGQSTSVAKNLPSAFLDVSKKFIKGTGNALKWFGNTMISSEQGAADSWAAGIATGGLPQPVTDIRGIDWKTGQVKMRPNTEYQDAMDSSAKADELNLLLAKQIGASKRAGRDATRQTEMLLKNFDQKVEAGEIIP